MIKVLTVALIIAMTFLFIQVWFTSESQKETQVYKAKVDSLQHVLDSTQDELYPAAIELNRYQIGYEIFKRRNPKAASQYGDIISDETE
jgi:hypothetical protein